MSVSDVQGLSDLSQCAYALGMAFGREAQAAAGDERNFRLYELFERCFHGFRVAVALKLRLAREAPRGREAADAEALGERDRPEAPDHEAPDHEAPDHEAPDRGPGDGSVERERLDYDREREAASLPILLKTLGGVAAAAEALPQPRPAELVTLRDLLARMSGAPAPGRPPPPPKGAAPHAAVAVLARPAAAAPPHPRARLLTGSAASGLPGRRRRATGPPGR